MIILPARNGELGSGVARESKVRGFEIVTG